MARKHKKSQGQHYFGLQSEIVRDSLDSLKCAPKSPLVVGGLAIQLHAREMPSYLRSTPDMDLVQENQNAEPGFDEFLADFYNHASEFFKGKGYRTVPKKGRGNNALILTKNHNLPDSQTFLLHLTKFSPRLYEFFFKDYVRRQIDYSKEIVYDKDRKSVKAASLEEVIPLKLWRSTRYATKMRDLVEPVYSLLIENAKRQNWGQLVNSLPLLDFKTQVDSMQNKINDEEPFNRELIATYKLTKDIYDILLSSRVISDSMVVFDHGRYQENIARIFHR